MPEFKVGDRVKINAGLFNGRHGEVKEVDSQNRKLRVRAEGMPTQETVLVNFSDVESTR